MFYDFGYTGNKQALMPQNSVVWVRKTVHSSQVLRLLRFLLISVRQRTNF